MSTSEFKLMTEWNPILFNQNFKPVKSSIERIKNQLGKRCNLCSSIPTICTMNKNSLSSFNIVGNFNTSNQNLIDHIHPFETFQLAPKWRQINKVVTKLKCLFVSLSNSMNIFNIPKFNSLNILVELNILISSRLYQVTLRSNFWSSVKNDDLFVLDICSSNASNHKLIITASYWFYSRFILRRSP